MLDVINADVMIRDQEKVIKGEVEIPLNLGRTLSFRSQDQKHDDATQYVRHLLRGNDDVVRATASALVGLISRTASLLQPLGGRVLLLDHGQDPYAFILRDNDLSSLLVKEAARNLGNNHQLNTLVETSSLSLDLLSHPEVVKLHRDIWEAPFRSMCDSRDTMDLMVRESWAMVDNLEADFILQATSVHLGTQAQSKVSRELAASSQVELNRIMDSVRAKNC